ncbi:MAG: hypothetical protein ABR595_09800 [Psychroflexus sp.]
MKTTEIREKLIREINLSNNKNLLKEFYHYINQDNVIQKPYVLNETQHSAIEEARNQIKNGDFLTNKQANQEIEEWLNK